MAGSRAAKTGLAAAGVLLTLLALRYGFGFYAPEVGRIDAGSEYRAQAAVARNRARIEAADYMAPGGRRRPTLRDIASFYGLEEDALLCTVRANHGDDVRAAEVGRYADRSVALGEKVVLCLD